MTYWEKFACDKRVISIVKNDFQFSEPTPVQEKCIPEFLSRKDVVVQAPTGSGKTLAYAIPLIEILLRRAEKWQKFEIGGLVLAPNRELAHQIYDVIKRLIIDLPLSLKLFVGGTNVETELQDFKANGANIVVATPGRLDDLLSKCVSSDFNLQIQLKKSLEILILDEADRLLDMGFQNSLTSILACLPKQRRTGLFSATQAKCAEDLLKTGLRNPVKIVVKGEYANSSCDHLLKTPASLKNYYSIVDTISKLAVLYKFIRQHRNEKMLIFLSTCACVEYFGRFLKSKLSKTCTIMTIHGKQKSKRHGVFERFRKAEKAALLCTDVMARGIDVPYIDWVVQFDPPRNASWFVHRCGRTARVGRDGNALLLLTPNEEEYANFLEKNQKVKLERMMLSCSEKFSLKMMETLRKMARHDRNFLERGSKAFVSYIQSYAKHDCGIVCSVNEIDVVNVAHSYGLLRLPKMPELCNRDLSGFQRCSVNTADIPYLDKTKEQSRQDRLVERRGLRTEEKRQYNKRREDREKRLLNQSNEISAKLSRKQRDYNRNRKRRQDFDSQDLNDIDKDYKLMKRLKKGKLSKGEFDEKFLQ